MLESGEVDVATIPAAAYTRIADLCIVPNIAIASRQAVRSILLVCKVPREQIRRVALDTSSMTSVALTKVLLSKWRVAVESYASAPPILDDMLAGSDAALLIGDPALQVDRSRFETYDLCEEWVRLTGKSFVFAFWAVRRAAAENARAAHLVDLLQRSRDEGLRPESLVSLSQEWAPRLGRSVSDIQTYFAENLYYYLDGSCREGLRLFYRYATECGALPQAPELTYL